MGHDLQAHGKVKPSHTMDETKGEGVFLLISLSLSVMVEPLSFLLQ